MVSFKKRAFTIMLAIVTVITMSMSTVSLIKPVKAASVPEVHINAWFAALEDARDYFNGGNPDKVVYKYNKSSDKKNCTNCAGYVSKAMQNMGWLKNGKKIWLSKKINGSGKDQISKNFNISYPKKKPAKANLQPGDICGFQWGASSDNKVHTMVYAGEKDGHPMWYSFSSATENWNTGPLRLKKYEERDVQVLLRYKNLKTGDYKIKTSVKNGTITKKTSVAYQGDATISYSPNTGYILDSVKVDGKDVDITKYPSSYTFKKVTANHEISVKFVWENADYLPEAYRDAVLTEGVVSGIEEYEPSKDPVVSPSMEMIGPYLVLIRQFDNEIAQIETEDPQVALAPMLEGAADGEYSVYIAGAVSDDEMVVGKQTFVYDTTAPKISLSASTDGNTWKSVKSGNVYADKVMVSCTAEDVFDNGYVVPVEEFRGLNVTAKVNGNDVAVDNGTVTLKGAGDYTVKFYAKDYAGNKASKKVSVKVAKTPKVTYSGPKDNSKAKKPGKITAKSDVKGKMTMKVYRNGKHIKTVTGNNAVSFSSYSKKGKYVFKTYCTSNEGIKSKTVKRTVSKT